MRVGVSQQLLDVDTGEKLTSISEKLTRREDVKKQLVSRFEPEDSGASAIEKKTIAAPEERTG
jgi:hypothetical protein